MSIPDWSRSESDCTDSGLSHCCRDEGFDRNTELLATTVTAATMTTAAVAVDKRSGSNPTGDGATDECCVDGCNDYNNDCCTAADERSTAVGWRRVTDARCLAVSGCWADWCRTAATEEYLRN